MKLGFNGSKENKKAMIASMLKHIQLDEVTRYNYLAVKVRNMKDDTKEYKGCAISCIAYEDLNDAKVLKVIKKNVTGPVSDRSITSLYKRVNELLNVPNIGMFIDIIHEDASIKETFNLSILEVLKTDVDYSSLVKDYIQARITEGALKGLILNMPKKFNQENRDNVKFMLNDLSYNDRKGQLNTHFLEFIEMYNKTHKVTEIRAC